MRKDHRPSDPNRTIRSRLAGNADTGSIRAAFDRLLPTLERKLGDTQPPRLVVVGRVWRPSCGGQTLFRPGPNVWIWLSDAALKSENYLSWVLAHEFGHVLVSAALDWPHHPSSGQAILDEYLAERQTAAFLTDSGVDPLPCAAQSYGVGNVFDTRAISSELTDDREAFWETEDPALGPRIRNLYQALLIDYARVRALSEAVADPLAKENADWIEEVYPEIFEIAGSLRSAESLWPDLTRAKAELTQTVTKIESHLDRLLSEVGVDAENRAA